MDGVTHRPQVLAIGEHRSWCTHAPALGDRTRRHGRDIGASPLLRWHVLRVHVVPALPHRRWATASTTQRQWVPARGGCDIASEGDHGVAQIESLNVREMVGEVDEMRTGAARSVW